MLKNLKHERLLANNYFVQQKQIAIFAKIFIMNIYLLKLIIFIANDNKRNLF